MMTLSKALVGGVLQVDGCWVCLEMEDLDARPGAMRWRGGPRRESMSSAGGGVWASSQAGSSLRRVSPVSPVSWKEEFVKACVTARKYEMKAQTQTQRAETLKKKRTMSWIGTFCRQRGGVRTNKDAVTSWTTVFSGQTWRQLQHQRGRIPTRHSLRYDAFARLIGRKNEKKMLIF